MVTLKEVSGTGKDQDKSKSIRPFAEIYLRQNLGKEQIEELRTTLEGAAAGAFSFGSLADRTTVLVSSVEDLHFVRNNFSRMIDAWKEITADD